MTLIFCFPTWCCLEHWSSRIVVDASGSSSHAHLFGWVCDTFHNKIQYQSLQKLFNIEIMLTIFSFTAIIIKFIMCYSQPQVPDTFMNYSQPQKPHSSV